ncbi:MAG: DUF1552 domain-containing protein [Verrucomicrobiae bacterium]|nr:DUF1552 domain-containing protein [Verrucomicrobiae bacterium]MCP5539708.1 DUF1552 domain-containing protein [Akkermansiaceae bacterium]MCP5549445.1 DUF1552 domain-containing protein [Akkermansiaceae bacterium]
MNTSLDRRRFLHKLGASAAVMPFLGGLPGLRAASASGKPKQRLILMFSPNGTIPPEFWPDAEGEKLELKRILKPLAPFRDRVTTLNGVCNKVDGDGDRHMRGMSCLLTGTELFPGNIQGGSDTPAGWASGISIDQELKNFLQNREETKTRFGSLEFGVEVPDRADPWTRMSYAGPNKPVAPISDPRQMLGKLYGKMKDKESLASILDDVRDEIGRVSGKLSAEDRELLDEQLTLVRELESELREDDKKAEPAFPMPEIDPNIELVNDNTPRLSRMQIDLLVNAMANDMTRVATLQFMRSVGQARMHWLGIDDGHHSLSHEPDDNKDAVEKLTKINEWFCGELAYLTKRLADTPEPGGDGNMLDHTLIVWLNELGKGNSHTLDNIPMVLVGGKGHGFRTGRALKFDKAAHNRLWLTVAHAMGHGIDTFGTAKFCEGGALNLG